ncbi:MAG: hypothetical protein AAFR34_00175 [Pseudomonadota bacterium]
MSAPNTNMERQKRRHWPALVGFIAVGVFAALVVLLRTGAAIDQEGPLVKEMVDDSAPALKSDPQD